SVEDNTPQNMQPVVTRADNDGLTFARRLAGQRLDRFEMGDEDEIAGAGIVANLLQHRIELRLAGSFVSRGRIERGEVLDIAEGEVGGFPRPAIAAGQHTLGGRGAGCKQRTYLACLLLAAL